MAALFEILPAQLFRPLAAPGAPIHLDQAAQRVFQRRDAPSLEAAAHQLLEQARAIREQFEMLDTLLEAIDVRHSQFVDAAVRAVELQLLAQSTPSGHLNAILKTLLASPDESIFPRQMSMCGAR